MERAKWNRLLRNMTTTHPPEKGWARRPDRCLETGEVHLSHIPAVRCCLAPSQGNTCWQKEPTDPQLLAGVKLTAAVTLSSPHLGVRLTGPAEAAVSQRKASDTVRFPWLYWLRRRSARVTVRRRVEPRYSVRGRPAARFLHPQTACVSVSISLP